MLQCLAPQECSNQALMAQPLHSNSPLTARWCCIARERFGNITGGCLLRVVAEAKKQRKHHQRPNKASKNVAP